MQRLADDGSDANVTSLGATQESSKVKVKPGTKVVISKPFEVQQQTGNDQVRLFDVVNF